MKPIIEVGELSKDYNIMVHSHPSTIGEEVSNLFSGKRRYSERVSALRDVSFMVEQGESVGIIGANGSPSRNSYSLNHKRKMWLAEGLRKNQLFSDLLLDDELTILCWDVEVFEPIT